VDDVVVKTRNSDTLIADLEETFASLREYQWKLNPNKCVFGVPSGKLSLFSWHMNSAWLASFYLFPLT
jgi:hypothetical protein